MKKFSFILLTLLSIGVTALHFILFDQSNTMEVGIESFLLNVIPYGLPILVFSLASRASGKGKPRWSKAGANMMALFVLSFLVMSAHVTIAYFASKQDFINTYFNVPLLYAVPLLLFALLWLAMKKAPEQKESKKTIGDKIINGLPVALLIAMLIHCGVVAIIDAVRLMNKPMATSFPWWAAPLLIALAYIAAIGVSLLIRGIYNYFQRHRKE